MAQYVFTSTGELQNKLKMEMIDNFGLFIDGSAVRVACECQERRTEEGRPLFGAGFGGGEESCSCVVNQPEINLRNWKEDLSRLGVRCIASGASFGKKDVDDRIVDDFAILYAMDIGNLENCEDSASHRVVLKAINELGKLAFEKGAKALIIRSEKAKYFNKNTDSICTNFIHGLYNLLKWNFRLEFRDEKSKAQIAISSQEKQAAAGSAIALGEASEAKKVSHQSVYDPFHPLTDKQIWMHLSLGEWSENESEDANAVHDKAWKWWCAVQDNVGVNPKLALCLELSAKMPDNVNLLDRWIAERLRCIIIPEDLWKLNKFDFPILPRQVRSFLSKTFHLPHVKYLLRSSNSSLDPPNSNFNLKNKFLYLLHCYKEYYRSTGDPERFLFSRSLAEVPIRPLQPLRDHLTQEIYSVFEMDVVKYQLYNKACYEALKDLKKDGRGLSEEDPIIAMVVGAGRGPLVDQFISAAVSVGVSFKVFAVDKNPIAISAMVAKMYHEWLPYVNSIEIHEADMRDFNLDTRADILISELLGSFACNELSPECLDGAQRLLKPNGISIPSSYVNFLQPVMVRSLYEDIASFARQRDFLINDFVLCEMRSVAQIAPYQKAFSFHHPNYETHFNEQKAALTFLSNGDYILSGFAGYFELVLYKDVSMNILPNRHTKSLTSWFPAFFPLIRPVAVKSGDAIQFCMRRRVDEKFGKVWYVWHLLRPVTLAIQNAVPEHWKSM